MATATEQLRTALKDLCYILRPELVAEGFDKDLENCLDDIVQNTVDMVAEEYRVEMRRDY